MDDEPKLPIVTAPVTPVPLPKGFDIPSVAVLVRDLSVRLKDLPDILKDHGLTEDQYKTLQGNEFFQRSLETFTLQWNDPKAANKRLAMLAAAGLEDAMPVITARMQKDGEQLANIIEVAKLFAKMSGVGEDKAATNAPTEKFNITINLGEDTVRFEKSRPIIEMEAVQSDSEGPGTLPALPSVSKIQGSPATVRSVPEGEGTITSISTLPQTK